VVFCHDRGERRNSAAKPRKSTDAVLPIERRVGLPRRIGERRSGRAPQQAGPQGKIGSAETIGAPLM
jgi:hypothetical protein